jgi:DNA-directed RNA polymerase subunit RPC12/RpoP
MSKETEMTPPEAHAVTLRCARCGREFQSWTDADLSDPRVSAFVDQLKQIIVCNSCIQPRATSNYQPYKD